MQSPGRVALADYFSVTSNKFMVQQCCCFTFVSFLFFITLLMINSSPSRFIIGFFLGAIPWYIGALLLWCSRVDYREKPGYVACTAAVSKQPVLHNSCVMWSIINKIRWYGTSKLNHLHACSTSTSFICA